MNQFQSIDEIFAALRRRVGLILFVIAAGCAVSVFFALRQVKVYEATAVVQIEDARVRESTAGGTAPTEDASRRVRLIEQRMMSRDNLAKIMEKHNLFMDLPDVTLNQRVFMMREAARIQEIKANPQNFGAAPEAPSGLMITVTLNDPQKAADVANELMYTVIEQSRTRGADRAREALGFFEEEEARVAADIEAMALRIAEFKTANADGLPAGVSSLRDQQATLEDTVLELDREIVALQTNSARQREGVLERQIALLSEQKSLVEERIASLEETIRQSPEIERALSGLERELTQLQDQYSVITRRKAEAEMGQALEDRQQSDRFEVLETALVPEVPASQSRRKLAIMGGVASIIAGFALAFIVEMLNPVIRSADQMERMLGMQPVVAVPYVQSRGERRRRGLGLLAMLVALGAAIWAVLRFGGGMIPWQSLIERVLPRAAQT
ncbi:GumC family protein [Salipiger sp.]|uniref:GumC family protein n=1 Tax=Salipiger sp. TaxID=2078585 RepID=UPI003A979AEC